MLFKFKKNKLEEKFGFKNSVEMSCCKQKPMPKYLDLEIAVWGSVALSLMKNR